jgi:hypothetical protein
MGHYTLPIRAGSVNHVEICKNWHRLKIYLVISSLMPSRQQNDAIFNPTDISGPMQLCVRGRHAPNSRGNPRNQSGRGDQGQFSA